MLSIYGLALRNSRRANDAGEYRPVAVSQIRGYADGKEGQQIHGGRSAGSEGEAARRRIALSPGEQAHRPIEQ
jgi:hypothetical protein